MKRLFLVGCLLVASAQASADPVAIGTPASGNNGGAQGTSLTFAATCPSGSTNVVAVVCANIRRLGSAAVTPVTVTWNGSSMTAVGAGDTNTTDMPRAELFILTTPTCDSAAHNVVITVANAHFIVGNVLFLKDVNLTTPADTAATATGASTAPTVNVTSASGDLVVDCVVARNSSTDLAAGSGQTQQSLNQTTNGTPNQNGEGGQSTEPGAAPNVTMSWTNTIASVGWAQVGVSINPVVVSTRRRGVTPYRFLKLPTLPFFFGAVP